jgi:anti-sigma regulatory factor (Ser/Thr protein kinase)
MGSTDGTLQEPANGEIMMWRRTFAGLPEQASQARHFVAFLLDGHRKRDDAIEVTGELACNALRHTDTRKPGGTFTIEIRRWNGSCASIAVTDGGGADQPVVRAPIPVDPEDLDSLTEGGRGFPIISELASTWGWNGDVNGRTVTAILFDE